MKPEVQNEMVGMSIFQPPHARRAVAFGDRLLPLFGAV